MHKEYLTIREVMERLPITRDTAAKWCASGKLPAIKIGRKWLIKAEEFENVLNGGQDND